MTEANKITLSGLPPEQIARRQKRLRYFDISIAVLAAALCGFISQYYSEAVIQKYILIAIFAVIGLYYGHKLLETNNQPIATLAWSSEISAIVMLNENGNFLKEWDIRGKVALLIGKNTKNKAVDIDLSDSTYDALIHHEHAIMNFSAGNWYMEGLHTPSSISVKKASDQIRYRLTGNRPCKLEQGDIVYIANTRLFIK